jgi:hypothetical protein
MLDFLLSPFRRRAGALPTPTEALREAPPPERSGAPSATAETTRKPVRIDELADAKALAGPLFRRKFGQEIPDFPRHFVALIGDACAGYVHYTAWQGDYLCGGLCIDDRVYRTLSTTDREWLRERGGIAEIMMRAAHEALTDGATIWGYIGDKQAEAVDRRVGFEKVAEPYLFAIWRKPISEAGKLRRIAEAVKLGAF